MPNYPTFTPSKLWIFIKYFSRVSWLFTRISINSQTHVLILIVLSPYIRLNCYFIFLFNYSFFMLSMLKFLFLKVSQIDGGCPREAYKIPPSSLNNSWTTSDSWIYCSAHRFNKFLNRLFHPIPSYSILFHPIPSYSILPDSFKQPWGPRESDQLLLNV